MEDCCLTITNGGRRIDVDLPPLCTNFTVSSSEIASQLADIKQNERKVEKFRMAVAYIDRRCRKAEEELIQQKRDIAVVLLAECPTDDNDSNHLPAADDFDTGSHADVGFGLQIDNRSHNCNEGKRPACDVTNGSDKTDKRRRESTEDVVFSSQQPDTGFERVKMEEVEVKDDVMIDLEAMSEDEGRGRVSQKEPTSSGEVTRANESKNTTGNRSHKKSKDTGRHIGMRTQFVNSLQGPGLIGETMRYSIRMNKGSRMTYTAEQRNKELDEILDQCNESTKRCKTEWMCGDHQRHNDGDGRLVSLCGRPNCTKSWNEKYFWKRHSVYFKYYCGLCDGEYFGMKALRKHWIDCSKNRPR